MEISPSRMICKNGSSKPSYKHFSLNELIINLHLTWHSKLHNWLSTQYAMLYVRASRTDNTNQTEETFWSWSTHLVHILDGCTVYDRGSTLPYIIHNLLSKILFECSGAAKAFYSIKDIRTVKWGNCSVSTLQFQRPYYVLANPASHHDHGYKLSTHLNCCLIRLDYRASLSTQ
jgi:hypothetical protein